MATSLITCSSELMSNFQQAEIAAPDAQFAALQSQDGCSLLFSVGTDGVFYVTREIPGQSTGWQKTDLSSSVAADFAGVSISTRTFAVAQNRSTGAVDLAMVVTANGTDTLYLSLGNSNADTTWVTQPKWVKVPYDDAAHPLTKLVVANVFMSQASDGEYIVVDALRNPADAVPVIFRYYIDSTKRATGQAWNPHDVAADLDASKISSCLGRRTGDRVDGLYTLGGIGGHASLIFQPLYNPFNPRIPANPVRLVVPAGVTPTALASVAVDGNSTDLYVAGNQALYYFPAGGQSDGATGVQVLSHPIFEGVTRLFAFATASEVIVWGLNRADQIFYTRCPRAQVLTSAAWSYPVPLLDGVEQLSPYVNRVDDGNTFFAHTGVNSLVKAVQSPNTTIWKFQNILLPTLPTAKAGKFSSYTTRIQVTSADRAPLVNTPIQISALSRTNVTINSRYYVLDTTPIPVPTDASGGLVIVERVEDLQAACLRIQGDSGPVIAINPMDKPFQKAAQLGTADALAKATIPNRDGTSRPLVAPGTSKPDLDQTAAAIASLTQAYQKLPADGSAQSVQSRRRSAALPAAQRLQQIPLANVVSLGAGIGGPASRVAPAGLQDFSDAIEVAAGDLFRWLDSAADYVLHIVQEVGEDVWHFIAEIAGEIYRFVLDSAVKVLGALEYVFKVIKTAIEDVIDFLKFLFDWDDFVRTKDVCKKVLLLYFDNLLDGIEDLKGDFNDLITQAKNSIDDWAGVKRDDWQPSVPNSGQPASHARSVTDTSGAFSSPGTLLFHHFNENAAKSQGNNPASADVLDSLLQRVIQALKDEGNVFVDAVHRIQSELIEKSQYTTMSLGDVLKAIVAIVVDALLNSVETLTDLLIDVFVMLAKAAVDALDTPIWIPVVSDILEDAFGVTIPFSILDVVCMVGAVPATLVYKVATGKAPFSSDDGFSDKILAAKKVADLQAAFGTPPEPAPRKAAVTTALAAAVDPGKQQASFIPIQLPAAAQEPIFMVGHLVGGIVSIVTAVLTVADALEPEGEGQFETAVGVSAAVGAVSIAIPGLFAAPYPIQNPVMSKISSVASGMTLLGKIAFKVAPKAIAKKRGITDPGELKDLGAQVKVVGTGFDAVIAVVALVPTCYHFYELAQDPAGKERSLAIIDETSNIVNDLSRVTSLIVQLDEEPESKAVLAAVLGILIALYGGLQIAEAMTDAAG